MLKTMQLSLLLVLATSVMTTTTTKPEIGDLETTMPIITNSTGHNDADSSVPTSTVAPSQKPPQYDMMTQRLEISSVGLKDEYHYTCTVGRKLNDHVICNGQDATNWNDPHNIELKLRCPKAGSGSTITFTQIDIWITSQQLECKILSGGIGNGYIELLVAVQNTKKFNYICNVYS